MMLARWHSIPNSPRVSQSPSGVESRSPLVLLFWSFCSWCVLKGKDHFPDAVFEGNMGAWEGKKRESRQSYALDA